MEDDSGSRQDVNPPKSSTRYQRVGLSTTISFEGAAHLKVITKKIKEIEGAGRLGPHVEAPAKSRVLGRDGTRQDSPYKRHGRAFNQGDLGSCTGNLMAGLLMQNPMGLGGP
jgi:hypothetical protein